MTTTTDPGTRVLPIEVANPVPLTDKDKSFPCRLTIVENGGSMFAFRKPARILEQMTAVTDWTNWELFRRTGRNPPGGLLIGFPYTRDIVTDQPNQDMIAARSLGVDAYARGMNLTVQLHGLYHHPTGIQLNVSDFDGPVARAHLLFNRAEDAETYAIRYSDLISTYYGLEFRDANGGHCSAEHAIDYGRVYRVDDSLYGTIDEVVILTPRNGLDGNTGPVKARQFSLK